MVISAAFAVPWHGRWGLVGLALILWLYNLAPISVLHFIRKPLKNHENPQHLKSGKHFETAAALWTLLSIFPRCITYIL